MSEKHANFIVNDRKGTAADVRGLVDDVAAAVRQETGIVLEPEVVFLGDWDRNAAATPPDDADASPTEPAG